LGFVFGTQLVIFLFLIKSSAKKQEMDMAALAQKVRDEVA